MYGRGLRAFITGFHPALLLTPSRSAIGFLWMGFLWTMNAGAMTAGSR